jgi:hypothetical protein
MKFINVLKKSIVGKRKLINLYQYHYTTFLNIGTGVILILIINCIQRRRRLHQVFLGKKSMNFCDVSGSLAHHSGRITIQCGVICRPVR